MATEVYTTEIIILLDDEEVELRPLPIAKLRKFTRLWTEHLKDVTAKIKDSEAKEDAGEEPTIDEASLTDAQFDVFIKMCALGLESQLKGEKTEKQFLAYLEDVLDEKTIHRILYRTGGLTLGDEAPNQMTPQAVQLPPEGGTN